MDKQSAIEVRGWVGRCGIIGAILLMLSGMSVEAATTQNKGFTVSPAYQEISVRPTQERSRYGMTIMNQTLVDQNFRLSVVDFGALDEQGGVAFLGQPASELEHRYGLASWMVLEKDAVMVRAGESVQIIVTIENRASLAPGGHYGAVLATAVTESGQPIDDPRVGIKQVLSSLVMVTKMGGGLPSLKLNNQIYDGGWWRLPTAMDQRFQNTGNVHVVPRGVTEIKDAAGNVVVRGALNEASGAILPESFRRYKTKLTKVAGAWMPGRYEITTTYRYDGSDKTQVSTLAFWYVGAGIVWAVGLGAALAIFLLAKWLWRRKK